MCCLCLFFLSPKQNKTGSPSHLTYSCLIVGRNHEWSHFHLLGHLWIRHDMSRNPMGSGTWHQGGNAIHCIWDPCCYAWELISRCTYHVLGTPGFPPLACWGDVRISPTSIHKEALCAPPVHIWLKSSHFWELDKLSLPKLRWKSLVVLKYRVFCFVYQQHQHSLLRPLVMFGDSLDYYK